MISNLLRNIPEVVKNLLIINVLLYIGLMLKPEFFEMLAMHDVGSKGFRLWQPITSLFVHDLGSFTHIIFNMFNLVFFGSIIEQKIGAKRFLILYFFSAVGSVLLSELIHFFEYLKYYEQFSLEEILEFKKSSPSLNISFGASGAIAGLLAGALYYEPNRIFNLYGVLPLKFKVLIPILLLMDLFLGVANFSWDNIGHWAHLGGALFGFILVIIWKKDRNNFY